jgi:hypothetical protein
VAVKVAVGVAEGVNVEVGVLVAVCVKINGVPVRVGMESVLVSIMIGVNVAGTVGVS